MQLLEQLSLQSLLRKESLKKLLILLAALPFTAHAQADLAGPGGVATNLMAQFNDVPQSAVSVKVEQHSEFTATVLASVPGKQTCEFEMAAIEKDANAQVRWGVGGTRCQLVQPQAVPNHKEL